jgi:hypothetical protein
MIVTNNFLFLWEINRRIGCVNLYMMFKLIIILDEIHPTPVFKGVLFMA